MYFFQKVKRNIYITKTNHLKKLTLSLNVAKSGLEIYSSSAKPKKLWNGVLVVFALKEKFSLKSIATF